MDAVLQSMLTGLPIFLGHFGFTVGLLALAVIIYMRLTPHDEVKLIQSGNLAAAISFGAAVLGLALPLAFTLSGSVNIWDIALWGGVILIIQLAAYKGADLVFSGLSERIENNEVAAAVALGSTKIAVASLNAAAIAIG